MTKLSWKTLDKLKSSQAIFELLLKHRIKGRRNQPARCPLAHATGFLVSRDRACDIVTEEIKTLTRAEKAFVFNFDWGLYPELDESRETIIGALKMNTKNPNTACEHGHQRRKCPYVNVFKILNDCLCSLRKYKRKEEARARRSS